nr:TSUP family transporter [Flavonifractor sp. An135]
MGWLMSLAVGAATGVLSAFGVGGGSLLLVYLTAFAGVEQTTAQGINLLYFLPAAAMALPAHWKNGYLDWKAARPAIAAGLLAAALGAWVATGVDVALLRKGFGVFLLAVGCKELFSRS